MDDYGTVLESGAVRFERVLPGPIERVWDYLTDSDKRGRWLAGGPMELRPGGRAELRFRHADLTSVQEPTPDKYKAMENGVSVPCTVTACRPPHLLSMTWDGAPFADSEVTFELSPQGTDVRLVLTHRKLPNRAMMVNVSGGWHTHLAILEDELAGQDRRAFWSTHARLEGEYEKRIAAE